MRFPLGLLSILVACESQKLHLRLGRDSALKIGGAVFVRLEASTVHTALDAREAINTIRCQHKLFLDTALPCDGKLNFSRPHTYLHLVAWPKLLRQREGFIATFSY